MVLKWEDKVIHGKFPAQLKKHTDAIGSVATVAWIPKGFMFPKTGGFLLGIQDNILYGRLENVYRNFNYLTTITNSSIMVSISD